MGEGILIYGLKAQKRHYYRDLQTFATDVIKRKRTNNSRYVFGRASKAILRDLRKQGIEVRTPNVAIVDKTIIKYLHHPKRRKGAVVSFNRWRMVEKAVKHPKNVYIDTHRTRLVYVGATKYTPNKVLKVVIDPNQRVGKHFYHIVVSIGVVNNEDMKGKLFQKIK